MSFILTFLGKGGTGRTTIAIAAAKRFASQGKRVLFAGQDVSPALSLLWETPLSAEPQTVATGLDVVQLQTTVLLERSWEDLKQQEAQYLRTPFLKAVYGQELGVLPGMDSALILNAIREYDASDRYDVIVYDGAGDQATLRMLGMPEILSWYIRRFRQVFADSDLGKTISPFIQPVASAVLNVNWSGDVFNQPAAQQVNNILAQGTAAVADPNRVAAYLVTTGDRAAQATAKYLWGSAQQVGVTVGGVVLNQSMAIDGLQSEFDPLPIATVPTRAEGDWQTVMNALPDFTQATQVPRPIATNIAERKVALFLPGFDKKQVKLTQYGPEVTIEAGDQRRNIFLPPELSGRQVTGAKFQDGYLIISF
ncbi:ArsA family ATPase [Oscillatoria sp. FACHB-1407]|uniref:Get3/ArsA fold putative tail anchor-mediating ATPase NosAFP n=1 Tax=Oscillatoria sp. FACHB-1407 TaxID=2692847 RepID=UPI001681EDF2|nr:ArsA family ATPase [Oscillatoria sp. FACHB-1407]MBD2465435.1 ArsA family ATPase [Oscillatoria sp. FACHB-1407]